MALTEREIFDQMRSSLSSAAADCDEIANGAALFGRMRQSLKLAEGSCRQMAEMRGDARWLTPRIYLEKAHQIARAWLHRPSVQGKKLFTGLGAALRTMLADIDKLQNQRVGRTGLILPNAISGRGPVDMPFRGALPNASRLILPAGLNSHGLI